MSIDFHVECFGGKLSSGVLEEFHCVEELGVATVAGDDVDMFARRRSWCEKSNQYEKLKPGEKSRESKYHHLHKWRTR